MKHFFISCFLTLGSLSSCLTIAESASTEPAGKAIASKQNEYQTVSWTDLIPESDLEALLSPPDYYADIVDGSEDDMLGGQFNTGSSEFEDAYQRALNSTTIRPEWDNQLVRIPGFIVPLEFDDDQVVTSFFLVPYFGACIHQPPPPPNQIIYSDFKKGIKLEVLYDAFWIEGKLSTTLIENELATAAYSLEVKSITPYQ